jgi:hypothetical protein
MIYQDNIERVEGLLGFLDGAVEGRIPEKYWSSASKVVDKMISEGRSQETIDLALDLLYPELQENDYEKNDLSRKIDEEFDSIQENLDKIKKDYSL